MARRQMAPSESDVNEKPERSPRLVMPSAVSVMHPAIRVKWLAVQMRCEGKSRIDATIRERSGGRSLALPVACKLAQPRQAVISALQAVGIIVGIIWLSGCRQCRECHAHKRRGSNELEHFIFLPLTAIHGALPSGHHFRARRPATIGGISKAALAGSHKAVC